MRPTSKANLFFQTTWCLATISGKTYYSMNTELLLGDQCEHSALCLPLLTNSGSASCMWCSGQNGMSASCLLCSSFYRWLSRLSAKRWPFATSLACFLCITYFTRWCSHYNLPKPQCRPIEEFKHTGHSACLYWHKHILHIDSERPRGEGEQVWPLPGLFCDATQNASQMTLNKANQKAGTEEPLFPLEGNNV